MNGLLLLIICLAIFLCGYIFYGGWLCKQWGLGESDKETPAHTIDDGGIDYVPSKAPVLMGHHFSSIAGAGPITGPINSVGLGFGWLACALWIVIGGIFFGGAYDLSTLLASVRHGGKSIGEVIAVNMSKRAKNLFIIFCYLTLILVIAAFTSIVASTFAADTKGADGVWTGIIDKAGTTANQQVAMVSMLFIVIAIIYGYMVYRKNASVLVSTIVGVLLIVLIVVIGLNFHPLCFSYNTWMWIVAVYITAASVTPVWVLLQPRDFLSSFLLYAMLLITLVAVVVAHPSMDSVPLIQSADSAKPVFPVLFTTIACGAISGFHALISSGTTAKQLDKEKDAKPIAYGGMLLECVLAIMTLVVVAYAYNYNANAADADKLKGVSAIFGGGIAHMIDDKIPGTYNVLYTLLVLTYSAFCLTSLDTVARLARFMFQEFWIDSEKGETVQNVTGYKKVLTNPFVSTIFTVIIGVILGLNGYEKIWTLFGSANQLVAAIGFLAVATWLNNIGKNNKMLLIPMAFMIVVTVTSLIINTVDQFKVIAQGGADWGPWVQAIIGIILILLAIELEIEGIITISRHRKIKA